MDWKTAELTRVDLAELKASAGWREHFLPEIERRAAEYARIVLAAEEETREVESARARRKELVSLCEWLDSVEANAEEVLRISHPAEQDDDDAER